MGILFVFKDDIIDIKNPERIFLVTFIVDNFSGLFLHSSIYGRFKISINNK